MKTLSRGHPSGVSPDQGEPNLRRSLLVLEHVARVHDAGGIDSDVSFVDVPDDAVLIDQERGAVSEALLFVINAICFDDGAFEIAEDGEGDFDLFCKLAIGGNAVDAHAENLSFV